MQLLRNEPAAARIHCRPRHGGDVADRRARAATGKAADHRLSRRQHEDFPEQAAGPAKSGRTGKNQTPTPGARKARLAVPKRPAISIAMALTAAQTQPLKLPIALAASILDRNIATFDSSRVSRSRRTNAAVPAVVVCPCRLNNDLLRASTAFRHSRRKNLHPRE
jgi:hypothetical protein